MRTGTLGVRRPAAPREGGVPLTRTPPAAARGGELTLGVEEEFLLVDAASRAVCPRGPQVIERARKSLGEQVHAELFPTQVETATRPCATLAGLREELLRLRRDLAAAAREEGCLLVASGTPVVPAPAPVEVTDKYRYRRMVAEFGPITEGQGQGVCGCHVHLGVVDREEAVKLGNHLRPWLPVLQAIAANSPFRDGRDSGYASWRAMRWAQWPAAGPAPLFASAEAYDTLVDALIDSGILLDRRMVYWYARPSERYPTLEIRVADVNADVDTVVLLAGLVRGLAGALLADVRAGRPALPVPHELLRAAHWRAARDGLAGYALDLGTGRPLPAWELVERCVDAAAGPLAETGDLDVVCDLLERVRKSGGGAARQRAAYRRREDLRDVVDALAADTAAVEPADR